MSTAPDPLPDPQQPTPPQLKLFDAAVAAAAVPPPTLSRGMDLPQFFERYVRPKCLPFAAANNLKQYRESLRYWVRFTGNPTLADLDEWTEGDETERLARQLAIMGICDRFLTGLAALPGRDGEKLADNTIRKHCVAVDYCLRRAGPRCPRYNKHGIGIIKQPPVLEKPGVVLSEVEDNFSIREIGTWLNACYLATAPRLPGMDPADFWRALILFGYNTGLRIGSLIKLRWSWLSSNESGQWIAVGATAHKKKNRGRLYFINAPAAAALDMLARPADREAPIFAWPFSESYLQENRRAILAASGLPPERRLGFHALRKAFSTELMRINPAAASMALGHVTRNIAIDHYTSKAVMVEAMRRLPQPAWDARREGPQLRLF